MSETENRFWTEKEFLAIAKICRATLSKLKSKGLISYLKVGRRVLYDEQSLNDFKEKCARRVGATNR